jgi:hypothetical protein
MSDLVPIAAVTLFGMVVFLVALYCAGRMKAEQAKNQTLHAKAKKKVAA